MGASARQGPLRLAKCSQSLEALALSFLLSLSGHNDQQSCGAMSMLFMRRTVWGFMVTEEKRSQLSRACYCLGVPISHLPERDSPTLFPFL